MKAKVVKPKRNKDNSILGTVGQLKNYVIKNCPVLIPKENLKFFQTMQKASEVNPFPGYGNGY